MNITHGKTTHLVRLNKPKQAYQQSPTGFGRPTHKSQQNGKHVNYLVAKFQQKWNSWSSVPSSHNLSNQIIKWTRVHQGMNPFSTS